jgi:biopolymer transport protein TolQ
MEFAQAAPVVMKNSAQISPLEAIFQASPIVQLTLLILIAMSVVCWAIIFAKRKQFNLMRESNEEFLGYFWKASSLDDIFKRLDNYKSSPVANVFKAGFLELQRIADISVQKQKNLESEHVRFSGIDNLVRTLRKATDNEIALMESRLNMLATTGSTGPFIGLFGTVWGIMSAFHRIGQTGAASLAVVAPGISEALVATAIGLAAAIPAVVAYNHFLSRMRREELEVSNFTADFLNLVKRDFFKDE